MSPFRDNVVQFLPKWHPCYPATTTHLWSFKPASDRTFSNTYFRFGQKLSQIVHFMFWSDLSVFWLAELIYKNKSYKYLYMPRSVLMWHQLWPKSDLAGLERGHIIGNYVFLFKRMKGLAWFIRAEREVIKKMCNP